MSLFHFLACKTIQVWPDDRRVLGLHGPFAHPYDVSGPDTEERIIRRLAGAYRVAGIPLVALALFLCVRPDFRSLFGGLVASLAVGWLIVRAVLHPELRWLRRAERPSCDRRSFRDFVEQLGPYDRALLRRRRRISMGGFLGSCLCALAGVALVGCGDAVGYFMASFFALCAVRWGRTFLLSPQALLEMRSLDGLDLNVPGRAVSAGAHDEFTKPDPGPFPLKAGAGLWDPEFDGHL